MPRRYLSLRIWFCFYCCVTILWAVSAGGQVQVASTEFPDAPMPQQNSSRTALPDPTHSTATMPYAPLYARTILPTERAQTLTAAGKLRFVAHEMIRPINIVPAVVSAGYGVYNNSNPKYGQSAEAFGQRFAAASVRQTSFRLFSDGLLPIVFREDPRYYKMGEGSGWQRMRHALGTVLVTHNDAGARTLNYSAIAGRAFGAALTQAYYPDSSRGSGVVFQTFGTAVAGEMALDVIREFAPDKYLNRF